MKSWKLLWKTLAQALASEHRYYDGQLQVTVRFDI